MRLANAIYTRLSAESGGHPPIVFNGHLCVYKPPRGVYEPEDERAVQRLIMSYDGAKLTRQNAVIRLSDSDCAGVGRRLMLLATETKLEAKRGVAFSDVFVSVEDGLVVTSNHSHTHGATFGLPIAWNAPSAPGFWHTVLFDRVWRDDPEAALKAAVLAEFVGACLFGAAARFKKAVFLYGHRGNNGKSTIIEGVRALFDNPPMIEPHLIGNERVNTQLALARINTVPELAQDEFPAPEAIKAAIAGDPLRARYLYKQDFTFTPICGHLIAGNNLPTCKDMSNAFWSRWKLLECPREIPAAERVPLTELKALLWNCRSEIAHWAIEGAARLFTNNAYTEVPSSERALLQWRKKSDQLAQFLEEVTEPGPGVEMSLLYARYVSWAFMVGHRKMSKATFEERLRHRGVDIETIALISGAVQME